MPHFCARRRISPAIRRSGAVHAGVTAHAAKHYPFAPFEELRRFERIEASKPLQYIVEGDYAVAHQRAAGPHGFVPILLHREQGLWRVDQVETWKNLFFDGEGNYFLRNSNTLVRVWPINSWLGRHTGHRRSAAAR